MTQTKYESSLYRAEPKKKASIGESIKQLILLALFLPLLLLVLLPALFLIFLVSKIGPLNSIFLNVVGKQRTKSKLKHLKYLDLGGYSVAVRYSSNITDASLPLLVFVEGLGGFNTSRLEAFESIFQGYRIVCYDRPGLGASPLIPTSNPLAPRNAENLSEELYRVLHHPESPVKPPFILVGGSLGGIISRMFYYKHPQEVKAMLLLDPTAEVTFLGSKFSAKHIIFSIFPTVYRFMAVLSFIGLKNLVAKVVPEDMRMAIAQYSEEVQQDFNNAFVSPTNFLGSAAEYYYVFDAVKQMHDKVKQQHTGSNSEKKIEVPVAVMSAMNWDSMDPSMRDTWWRRQKEAIIDNARPEKTIQVLCENNTHIQVCVGEMKQAKQVLDELCEIQ